MKKYFHTPQYRDHSRRQQRRGQLEAERKRTRKGLVTARPNLVQLYGEIRKRKKKQRFKDYEFIVAPANFTLIGNTHPERVIQFINKVKANFEAKKSVFIQLEHVTSIDYDSIILLLAAVVRFKAAGIKFAGDYPNYFPANLILKESGFFEHLNSRTYEDQPEYTLSTKQNFITHASKEVDSELSSEIIENAARTVWQEPRRCQGVQTALNELMQNTMNHATPMKEGDKHWWLAQRHLTGERKVKFCFVDFGVGVFESLRGKSKDSKWFNAIPKMLEKFDFRTNGNLLQLIMNGELHMTVTGESFRGKGLPGMKELMEQNWFSRFHIITNNVYADVQNGIYRDLKSSFNGTFIYFELSREHQNWPKDDAN